jgi:hypothetical protein
LDSIPGWILNYRAYSFNVAEEKRIPHRLDFQVPVAITDRSYWAAMKSHFSYWTNMDLVGFMLNQLYAPAAKEAAEQQQNS